MGNYAGTVYAVYPDAVYCDTSIGMISILTNAHCLEPFSAIVSAVKELNAFGIEEGQQVLMGEERIEIPACEFAVDLSQSTDYDLSTETIKAVFCRSTTTSASGISCIPWRRTRRATT